MPIEGGWWTFTPEIKYEMCPRCGGSGMDNDTLDTKCWYCNGTGEVKVKKEDDDD